MSNFANIESYSQHTTFGLGRLFFLTLSSPLLQNEGERLCATSRKDKIFECVRLLKGLHEVLQVIYQKDVFLTWIHSNEPDP